MNYMNHGMPCLVSCTVLKETCFSVEIAPFYIHHFQRASSANGIGAESL